MKRPAHSAGLLSFRANSNAILRSPGLRAATSGFHRGSGWLSRSHRWRRGWGGRLQLGGINRRRRLRAFPLLREVGDLVFSFHSGLRSGRALGANTKNKLDAQHWYCASTVSFLHWILTRGTPHQPAHRFASTRGRTPALLATPSLLQRRS
jgi:hypothetical protein